MAAALDHAEARRERLRWRSGPRHSSAPCRAPARCRSDRACDRGARAVVTGRRPAGAAARGAGAPRCASATGASTRSSRNTAAAAPPAAITSFFMFIRLPREVDAPNSESLPQGNVSWNGAPDYLPIPAGIGNVTFPVAAHSAPRANVVTNAGVCTLFHVVPQRRHEDAALAVVHRPQHRLVRARRPRVAAARAHRSGCRVERVVVVGRGQHVVRCPPAASAGWRRARRSPAGTRASAPS